MGATQSKPCMKDDNEQSCINKKQQELPRYDPPTNDELCLSYTYIDGVNTTIFQFINYFVNSRTPRDLFVPNEIISLCCKYVNPIYPSSITQLRYSCCDTATVELNGTDKSEIIYMDISRAYMKIIASRPTLKIVVLKRMNIYVELQLISTFNIPTTFVFHVMGDVVIGCLSCYKQQHNVYIICEQRLRFEPRLSNSALCTSVGNVYIKCKQLQMSNNAVLRTNDHNDTMNANIGCIYIDVENEAQIGCTGINMRGGSIKIMANNIRIGTNSTITACIGNIELIARNKLWICAYSRLVGKQILLKYRGLHQGNNCVFHGVVSCDQETTSAK